MVVVSDYVLSAVSSNVMRSGPSSLGVLPSNMRPDRHWLRLWSKPRQVASSPLDELHASRRILDMREISRLVGCPSSMYRGRGKRFYSRFKEHLTLQDQLLRHYRPPPSILGDNPECASKRVAILRDHVEGILEAIRSDAAVYAGLSRRLGAPLLGLPGLQLTHPPGNGPLIGHD